MLTPKNKNPSFRKYQRLMSRGLFLVREQFKNKKLPRNPLDFPKDRDNYYK